MERTALSACKESLVTTATTCALVLASGEEPFFKRLEWWLADGAFNHAPFGMFRSEQPYQPKDLRTVRQFLAQPAPHRWEGTSILRDLFDEQVLEMLQEWAAVHLGTAADPLAFQGQAIEEWEDALMLVGLHPRVRGSAWEEFLSLPLTTVVEPWRGQARQVARERACQAARFVSRQQVEAAAIHGVAEEMSRRRRATPGGSVESWLAQAAEARGAFDVALYVRAAVFTQRLEASRVAPLQERYVVPAEWRSSVPVQPVLG